MNQVLKAIYEAGVFKPLEPVSLDEHQEVTLIVNVQTNTDCVLAEPLPTNGTELAEYWKRTGLFGSRPDIADSVEYARQLRCDAETR